MDESDCSSWPTPSAQQFEAEDLDRLLERQAAQAEKNGNNGFGMTLANEVQIWSRAWSTPKASDGEKGGPNMRGSKGDLPLPSQAAHWLTPMASDDGQKVTTAAHQGMLCNQASQWETPSVAVTDGSRLTRGGGRSDELLLSGQAAALSRSLAPQIAGGSMSSTDGPNSNQPSAKRRLNPIFVEALMRWPIGWTDFGCSETGSTQWRQDMRGYLWMLVTARIGSERQGALL